MHNQYLPDRWEIIVTPMGHRVLAGWYGGYLGSDEWRVSSGITAVEQFDDRFVFMNHSGSRYVCYHTARGLSGLTASMFESWHREEPAIQLDANYPETV